MRTSNYLHLVFGGELESLDSVRFRDLNDVDVVGVFPNYKTAEAAWRAKAQQTVDNAHMRYLCRASPSPARSRKRHIEMIDGAPRGCARDCLGEPASAQPTR
jgi:hypothetical protein